MTSNNAWPTKADAAKRYGRATADPGEPMLTAAPSSSGSPKGDELRPVSEVTFARDANRPASEKHRSNYEGLPVGFS